MAERLDGTARCSGCSGIFEVGDRYIEDTPSGFTKQDADVATDDLVASILGGSGGKVRFCEDCCTDGGNYLFETFYGDLDTDRG